MKGRRRNRRLGLIVSVALLLASTGTASAQTVPPLQVPDEAGGGFSREAKTYIVLMAGDPVVAYDGGVAGLAATSPDEGSRFNQDAPSVQEYRAFLTGQHDAALAAAGASGTKGYDYGMTFNGFSAVLTGAQAEALSRNPEVLHIFENELLHPTTLTTHEFLGLSAPGGAWSQGFFGQDTVVGIVDTGIWPENESFARRSDDPDGRGQVTFDRLREWRGRCDAAERWRPSDCNNKIVAGRFYHAGFGTAADVKALFPYEFISPRDAASHGSHVASTAAGNFGVTVRERGNRIGDISGMAPLARIAVYKACWGFTDDPDGGCWSNDSVAAIDQAVADGVDAINFSISGTSDNYLDAVEIAFLFANAAGIFVGAASGNEGPGAGTTNHPSPWLTTVAAGTHDRLLRATLTLGNGVTFEGASLNDDQTRNLPIVYAGDIPADGADPAEAALCFPETLDPQEARGKMVICDRGVNARVEKSQTVDEAGGRAMILVNVTPGTLNADIHYVPSIHLNEVDGLAVKLYASTNFRPRGRIGESRVETDPTAPVIAGFSSRGPSEAGGDILKPDIMAPGVDVLAAVSPIAGQGLNYDFFQGTSMATPHIVGIGAVLTSAHPDWSAAALRSAMMTTAMDTAAGAFDEGSGQAAPNAALNPGLVYDNTFPEYLGFLCGTGQLMSPACASLAIDPSDLNQPNISIGDLAGSQTVTRTVTNVGGAGTYNVAVNAPAGIDVVVSPTSLTLGAGESASYQVTLTRTTAALDTYAMGSLSWSDGTHNVRSVIAVRPVQLAAPDEVFGMGTTGSIDYTVDFGYSGPFSATPHGLLAATQTAGFVVDDPANNINTALATGVGITVHAIPVPAGTAVARFSLFDDFTDGNDDLDLYVFDSAGNFIGGSGTATSEEQVDVVFPAPGSYFVVVHGFATDESSGGPGSNYTLFNWNVSSAPNGGLPTDLMITAPTEAVLGTSATITVSWAGLTGGEKYLGAVLYNDGVGVIDLTIVTVNA